MSKWLRGLSLAFSMLIVLALGHTALQWAKDPHRFPLKKLDITRPLVHSSEVELRLVAAPFLKQGFFRLDVRALHDQLLQLPWIQSVDVRRLWPDRLMLAVQEHQPQAQWGAQGVLSTEGRIFYPAAQTIPATIPRFVGPDDCAKEMLENYLKFLEYLAPLGVKINQLECSNQGSWRMLLDKPVAIILGQCDQAALLENLRRFVVAYQNSLEAQIDRIAYIDLRYTNGLAIGWKAGMVGPQR